VLRLPKNADEDVLGRYVKVETSGDGKSNEADSIRRFLQRWASGTERWVGDPLSAAGVSKGSAREVMGLNLPAPFVYNEGKGEVRRLDNTHAHIDGLVVVLGVRHLRNDRQKSTCAG
jgi:hypothetical protein